MYKIFIEGLHNVSLSVANKKHKPLMLLGLSVFYFYHLIHVFIHCGDSGVFKAYEYPVLVQKSV